MGWTVASDDIDFTAVGKPQRVTQTENVTTASNQASGAVSWVARFQYEGLTPLYGNLHMIVKDGSNNEIHSETVGPGAITGAATTGGYYKYDFEMIFSAAAGSSSATTPIDTTRHHRALVVLGESDFASQGYFEIAFNGSVDSSSIVKLRIDQDVDAGWVQAGTIVGNAGGRLHGRVDFSFV